MVVCKFFLQGTCKFGSYCHNEHEVPSNYTSFSDSSYQSSSILRQSNFGSTQLQNTKSTGSTGNVDINTLVKSVVNDMTGAEKGGQWILSCYAPFKEKPAFPGFEDHSPEEIRLGFYEAQKNGTVDQYKAELQALFQSSVMKIKALQNPAQDVVTILQNIYNTPPSSYNGTYGQNIITQSTDRLNQQNTFTSLTTQNQSPFGQTSDMFKTNSQPNTTNIFNGRNWQQNQGQTNILGNSSSPTQNQNIFGGEKTQNNFFSSQPENNIFANASQISNTSNNIFGNSHQAPNNSNNIFRNSSQMPPSIFSNHTSPTTPQLSIFADVQPSQQPKNIFSSTLENQNQTIFSSQNMNPQSVFTQQTNQQTPQTIFAPQNPPQAQNIFVSQNQAQQGQNIFSSNINSTQFPNTQLSSLQAAPQNYSASIFGNSANQNPTVNFGPTPQQQVDASLYSKLEELTVEERKWFESDTLDIMNIPDKPPTYDMCFNV